MLPMTCTLLLLHTTVTFQAVIQEFFVTDTQTIYFAIQATA